MGMRSQREKEDHVKKALQVRSSVLLLLASLLLVPCRGLEAAESAVVTILHVNDTHSHLDPLGPRTPALAGTVGGVARAATVIARERAAAPNALFLHAGDAIITDPTFNAFVGVPAYEVLGMLGTDAFTYGNHEFDLGPGVLGETMLKQAAAFANVPLLGTNLENLSAVPSIQARTKSWIVKEVDGVRVGIFGLTIPDMPDARPEPLAIGSDTVKAARAALEEMRQAGAEVFVHLSHLGIQGDRELVRAVAGIDVVVGGHDHLLFTTPEVETAPDGKKVPILQAGSYFRYVGRLRFTVKDRAFRLVDYRAIPVDDSIPADPKVDAFVESLHPKIVAAYGDLFRTTLGSTGQALANTFEPGSFRRDTSLGNLIADAYRNYTKTEIALTSLAMLSDAIPAGPIVGLDVFRAVGYGYDPATGLGFRLATCRISGESLLNALKLVLVIGGSAEAVLPQTSGLTYAYNGKAEAAQGIVERSVFVNGRPLDLSRSYTLTSNEFVFELIGKFVKLEDVVILPGAYEYTVLKQEIERQGTVRSLSWGRIVDVAAGFDSVATE